MQQDVPDALRPGLRLVIVGINPGLRSGATGHAYAHAGNQFWPLLYQSGLISEPLTYADDQRVLDWDIGLTNLCDRTTRSQQDLTREEMLEGAENLREKLLRYRPRVVCFNGMGIYEAFSGRKSLRPGLQDERLDGDILIFVAPSSSGRTAAYQWPAKLALFRQLKALVDRVAPRSGVVP